MKKTYIKPVMNRYKSDIKPYLNCQLSPWKIESGANDYQAPTTDFMKTDNAPSSINMSTNERGGGFGDDSGPWESLW